MPALDANALDDIQGDIWPGLLKHYEIFHFFNITDAEKFKPQLEAMVAKITTACGAKNGRQTVFDHKCKSPEKLPISGINIAFSHTGLGKLLGKLGETGLKDGPFNEGQYKNMATKYQENWDPKFASGVDGVLLICGTKEEVETEFKQLKNQFDTSGVEEAITLRGEDLKSKPGHEHFGFKDGISQPELEELDTDTETPKKSFRTTPKEVIITGYDNTGEPDWAKNGSYMVFRKLKQFVPEFKSFLQSEAPKLGYSKEQLGARLLGRWESGAPVVTNPDNDNLNDTETNNFRFDGKANLPCPFAAHIRKARPRGDVVLKGVNPKSVDKTESKFDIIRRGIPYGQEATAEEIEGKLTPNNTDRGLLFVCYQSHIDKGFEFITNDWINAKDFAAKSSGVDPIMAKRSKNTAIAEDLEMSISDKEGKEETIAWDPFVESNGGEYFFMPSLTLLRNLANSALRTLA